MNKLKNLLIVFLGFLPFSIFSQVITYEPQFPGVFDTITIIYDASLGNGTLEGVETVYAHTGVLTSMSINQDDWKHKIAPWPKGDSILEMENLGNNLHQFVIYPKNFYNIHTNTIVRELCFVFRNQDGSLAGKNEDGTDIYIPIWSDNQNARFTAPVRFPLTPDSGEQINMQVTAKTTGMINIFHNGYLISQAFDNQKSFNITAAGPGKHWIKFTHQSGGITTIDSVFYLVQNPVNIQELPDGIVDGINVIDDNTIVFCLMAPWKERVYLIGDVNDWQIENEFQFNRTPDGKRWWYKLEDLEPYEEYRFQYIVDFDINIADPYSKKVLDPWNDGSIHPIIYPDLISYPHGKATEIVGVFWTKKEEYQWQSSGFQRPDSRDLVIYELLVRDWHLRHSYQTVIDSIDYLINLGVNAIELMPVNQFDGNDSWGYMPAFFFAPDKIYGTSDMLKEFIDICHQNGIAVILDMVFNHASGNNTMARLYYNKEKQRPTWQNPWFNELIPHPFGYHNDFDHESPYTQEFVDSVLDYWIEEYRFDGYRLDLSKGFTNNVTVAYDDEGDIIWDDVGAWNQYDHWRVEYLKNMGNTLWNKHPGIYIILEHLANFDEEKALSDHGFMLWCGMAANEQYAQAAMGYEESSNFIYKISYQHYQGNDLGLHNLVGYKESHDEERIVWKCYQYGNMHIEGNDTLYNIREKSTALQRMGQVAAFFFTVPGPKMFWQFGERGYDYSINWPALEDPGATRTAKKPPRWDYMKEPERQYLYKVFAALANLKTSYNIFRTSNYEMSTSAYDKRIRLWDDGYSDAEMQVVVLGNFNVVEQNVWPEFSSTGWWYDYFTGDSIHIETSMTEGNGFTFTYQPGEYHIYTDMKLPTPDLSVDDPEDEEPFVPGITSDIYNTFVFPNPFNQELNIEFSLLNSSDVSVYIYDISGKAIYAQEYINAKTGRNSLNINTSNFSGSAYYIYSIISKESKISGKILRSID
jgi:1,4-alpha-glucan branching enzyme